MIGSYFGGGGGWAGIVSAAGSSANSYYDYGGDTMMAAKGNVFAGPGINAYENTIVKKPVIFPFAKGGAIGIMGEGTKAEGVLPLTRTSSGNLGVEATMNGGGSGKPAIVNQYIFKGSTFMDQETLFSSVKTISDASVDSRTVAVIRKEYESGDGWLYERLK